MPDSNDELTHYRRLSDGAVEYVRRLADRINDIEAENERLRASVLNQYGDNLCWIESAEEAKALPEAEFLESCRRYRAQIAESRGELAVGQKTIAQLEAENESLRLHMRALAQESVHMHEWVSDLQSEMYVNCVYCGHRYGPRGETPVAMADILSAHVEKCPKHPMSALKSELSAAKDQIDVLKVTVARLEVENARLGGENSVQGDMDGAK